MKQSFTRGLVTVIAAVVVVVALVSGGRLAAAGAETATIDRLFSITSPGFCYLNGCGPDFGQDKTEFAFSFSRPLSAADVRSATLSFRSNVEMFVGQHDNMQPSTCEPIVGANTFTGVLASNFVVGLAGTTTSFPLDQIEIWETYPGLGIPWEAIKDTMVVDATQAVKTILAGGPAATIPVTIQFLSAPCSHANFKGVSASLTIETNPPNTISVTTNLPSATFTISGPASYAGTGTAFTQHDAPAGTYTATFGEVAGYEAPQPITQTLANGSGISFDGQYVEAAPPTLETIDPACASGGDQACAGSYLQDVQGSVSIDPSPERLIQATAGRSAVAADGVTQLLLRGKSTKRVTFSLLTSEGNPAGPEWGTLKTLSGVSGQTLDVAPVETSLGPFAFAAYQAPANFPVDTANTAPSSAGLPRGFRIEARSSFGSTTSTIFLHQPPVVLVHGVWSDGSAWNLLEDFLIERGFYVCSGCKVDYSSQPAPTFDPARPSAGVDAIVMATRAARQAYRRGGIAVSRIDLVGHSEGGLLARARVKSQTSLPYRRLDNYGGGEFRKIITVGTPHLGTPLAAWLVQHRCDVLGAVGSNLSMEQFFQSIRRPFGDAVYDFREGSQALKGLGVTDVPSHAIVATAPVAPLSGTEKVLNHLPAWSGNQGTTIGSLLGGDGVHDTIVPSASQAGRLPVNASFPTVHGLVHASFVPLDTAETESGRVFQQVADLLQWNVQDGAVFGSVPAVASSAPGPADPPSCGYSASLQLGRPGVLAGFSHTAAIAGRPSFASSRLWPVFDSLWRALVGVFGAAQPSATITLTPAPGTVVQPGDLIDVTFTVNGASPADGALFRIGRTVEIVDGTGPYTIQYRVPDVTGRIDVFADTFGTATNHSAVSSLVVRPSVAPTSIAVVPDEVLFLRTGEKVQLRTTGELPDGRRIDLTSGAGGTSYALTSGGATVAAVTADGLLEAMGAGRDAVLVSFAGTTATVNIVVDTAVVLVPIDATPPLLALPADLTVDAAGPNGTNVSFDVSASDDVDGVTPVTCSPAAGSTFAMGATVVTCSAIDRHGNRGSGSFIVTVVNHPPIAVADQATTTSDVTVGIPVLANDSDPDGGVLRVTGTSTPLHGTAIVAGNRVNYTPARGFVGTDSFSYTVSDGQGGTSAGAVSVVVRRIAELNRFVALGLEQIWLRAKSKVVSGNVGANTSRPGPARRGHDHGDDDDDDTIEVRIGEQATMAMGTLVAGDSVVIRARAVVDDVMANELVNRGTVRGTVHNSVRLPLVAIPALPPVSPGRQDVIVAKERTTTLPAGRYGRLQVKPRGTLVLTGGVYQIQSLDLEQQATVLIRGAVELRVLRELDTDSRARIISDPSVAHVAPSQIVIYVAGGNSDCEHDGRGPDGDDAGPAVVHVGEQSVIEANILAPHGVIWLKARTVATGAFIGERVRIGEQVELRLDSAFR